MSEQGRVGRRAVSWSHLDVPEMLCCLGSCAGRSLDQALVYAVLQGRRGLKLGKCFLLGPLFRSTAGAHHLPRSGGCPVGLEKVVVSVNTIGAAVSGWSCTWAKRQGKSQCGAMGSAGGEGRRGLLEGPCRRHCVLRWLSDVRVVPEPHCLQLRKCAASCSYADCFTSVA